MLLEEPFDRTNAARAVCNESQFDKIKTCIKVGHLVLASMGSVIKGNSLKPSQGFNLKLEFPKTCHGLCETFLYRRTQFVL